MRDIPISKVLSDALDAIGEGLSLLEIVVEKATGEEELKAREILESAQAALHVSHRLSVHAADILEGNPDNPTRMVPPGVEEEARKPIASALRRYLTTVYPTPIKAPTTKKEEADILFQNARKKVEDLPETASPEECAKAAADAIIEWGTTWRVYYFIFPLNTPEIIAEIFRHPAPTEDTLKRTLARCAVAMDQAIGGPRGDAAILLCLRAVAGALGVADPGNRFRSVPPRVSR